MNAPTTKAAADAIDAARLAHYSAMAAQHLADNRKPRATGFDAANETSARGPVQSGVKHLETVLHAYPYLGVRLQAFGNFTEDGKCKIRKIQAFGDKANLYNLIPAEVIGKMTITAEECAENMRQRAQSPVTPIITQR